MQDLYFPLIDNTAALQGSPLGYLNYRCWAYLSRGAAEGNLETRAPATTTLINLGGQRVRAHTTWVGGWVGGAAELWGGAGRDGKTARHVWLAACMHACIHMEPGCSRSGARQGA